MSSIVKYSCEAAAGAEVSCVLVRFRAKGVTEILKHTNTTKARRDHAYDEDKRKHNDLVVDGPSERSVSLDASVSNVNFVNESGLYALIFGSRLSEARVFKHWVTNEVLPAIRETGSYSAPLLGKQIKLLNETDLHYKVIDCIRNKFVELVVVPGLGEMQATKKQRIDGWSKGYIGGQPDILILNKTVKYDGFAIELKTPKGDGRLSDKQLDYLTRLEELNYKTLISNDYDVIVIELTKYYTDLCFPCKCFSKVFKSRDTLNGHTTAFHSRLAS
jgi:hypothetical protein